MASYGTKWPSDGPTQAELDKAWDETWDEFCKILDEIDMLKQDQDSSNIVKDGPMWQEIQKTIDKLEDEKKQLDRKLVSLNTDIRIYTGW